MPWRIISITTAIIIGLNLAFWHLANLGLFFGLVYMLALVKLQSSNFTGLKKGEAALCALLRIILIFSIIGSLAFYLDIFYTWLIAIIILVFPFFKVLPSSFNNRTNEYTNPWLIFFYVVFAYLTWHYLNTSQTINAIRSPWQVIQPIVWFFYFATSIIIIRLSYQKTSFWLLIPYYFLTFSVINIVYPLPFGFDSFIHQASEKVISLTGTISPKPFYYLGQYSLVIWLEKILWLPIKNIDQWLVPILSSIFIPFYFNKLARQLTDTKPFIWLLTLSPLILTIPIFTYTTPQALANLWALLTIIEISLNLLKHNYQVNKQIVLLTLATILTHPLTGLPLIGVVGLYYFIFVYQGARKKLYQYLSAGFIALSVPLAFIVLSFVQNSGSSLIFNYDILNRWQILGNNIKSALPLVPHFIDMVDLTYLWAKLLPLLAAALFILSLIKLKKEHQNLNFFALIFSLTASGYLLLFIFGHFPNLTPNEQFFYTNRLWDLSILWLWPLFVYGLYSLIKITPKIFNKPSHIIVGLALILTAGFYLSYPRLDLYNKDTAYNTTTFDQAAVTFIKNNEKNDYVALSNQAVAAAAIDLYGFDHYYQGNFYYPVPTGTNPLYKVYLEATETDLPTRDIIKKASDIAGVNTVYLVLNQYWSGFDKLTAVADTVADNKWSIGNDRIKIYKYSF